MKMTLLKRIRAIGLVLIEAFREAVQIHRRYERFRVIMETIDKRRLAREVSELDHKPMED